jgi:glycosyltransferase involved in cell wall biosynthesis
MVANLVAAIGSILAQTYGDFDFLISDNASIDSTEEICRACVKRDASIRYMRRTKECWRCGELQSFSPVGRQSVCPDIPAMPRPVANADRKVGFVD